MDYNLYIALQEKDLELVEISEIKANWGGKDIPYDPRRFIFQDKVKMFLSEYKMISGVETAVDKNQVMLRIANGLHELEWEVNKQPENLKTNNIMELLQKVCKLRKFEIYIFQDDEIIEHQIEYTHPKDFFLLVENALKWKSPQNIKIFYDDVPTY